MILFLDIEGTLIESIDNPEFLSTVSKFSHLIESAEEVHCFSWAICNERDLESCRSIISSIESDLIRRKFDSFIFRDSFFKMFRERFGQIEFFEFEEFCRDLGKEFVFQQFVRKMMGQTGHFILIDDMVENVKMEGSFDIIETLKA